MVIFMRRAIKNESKFIKAYELGKEYAEIQRLINEGKIKKISEEVYEIFSQEAVNGKGQIAHKGDFIKIDTTDLPYPNDRTFFLANHKYLQNDEYKQIYKTVICNEANQPDLPILYNVNFGHTSPVSILPYGVMAQIDCSQKKLTVIESPIERDLRSRNGEVRDER